MKFTLWVSAHVVPRTLSPVPLTAVAACDASTPLFLTPQPSASPTTVQPVVAPTPEVSPWNRGVQESRGGYIIGVFWMFIFFPISLSGACVLMGDCPSGIVNNYACASCGRTRKFCRCRKFEVPARFVQQAGGCCARFSRASRCCPTDGYVHTKY